MKRLRQTLHSRKGFTLVEVIVVLVILAIMAAMLVPKLTGWITEAKGKSVTGEAHLVLSAAQAFASEDFVKSATPQTSFTYENIKKYVAGDVNDDTDAISDTHMVDGKVTAFKYTGKNGVKIQYDSTNSSEPFSVTPSSP